MNITKRLHELDQPIFTSDVYIMCGDEVLMFKRSETKKKFPNFWSIPGGHIDENEDPLACAIREVREETGIYITPNDIKLRGVAIHHHLDRKEVYIAFTFVATLKDKVTTFPTSNEGSAHWVKKKDMMNMENVFPPVKYYFNHILNDHKGVMYDMSQWRDSKLVRVLSESVDQNG